MKKYKFKALPCISDKVGNTIRPYELDGEVIYEMPLNKLLEDEAKGRNDQIMALSKSISKKIGKEINPDMLVQYLKDKYIEA